MFDFLKKKNLALRDASEIIKNTNDDALQAAWNIYAHIKKKYPERYDGVDDLNLDIMTKTWGGLKKLVEYKGDFSKFTEDERQFLLEIRDGHQSYADVIHILIDHHDDIREAEDLFERFPRLRKVIPEEYNNPRQVIEVLIEIVREYQWQLEHFSINHYGEIEAALGERNDSDEV